MAHLPPIKARLRVDVDPHVLARIPDGERIARWLGAQDRGELADLPLAPSAETVLVEVVIADARRVIDEAVNQFLNQVPAGSTVNLNAINGGFHLSVDSGGFPRLAITAELQRR